MSLSSDEPKFRPQDRVYRVTDHAAPWMPEGLRGTVIGPAPLEAWLAYGQSVWCIIYDGWKFAVFSRGSSNELTTEYALLRAEEDRRRKTLKETEHER